MINKMPSIPNQAQNASPMVRVESQPRGTREVLGVILRRRWIILGILLPIFFMALIGTMQASDSITASSRVVVETHQPEEPTFYSGSVDFDVVMSTASQVVVSIPVAEKAAASLVDSIPLLMEEFPDFVGVTSAETIRDLILEHEDCSQVGETNILEISVSHPSGRFALMAVGALTRAFMEYNIEKSHNLPAVTYYEDQIFQVKAELDSLLDIRLAILEEYGMIAFAENARANAGQIVGMESSYYSAMANRESLEAMVEALREGIKEDPDFVPTLKQMESSELLGLKSMIYEEETVLTKLRQQYHEDSEWVQRQKEVVDGLRAKFSQQRDNLVRDLEIELTMLRGREASLSRSLEKQREMVLRYPEVDRKIKSVDVSVETQMDLLETLQTKRGEVRLKSETDSRVSNILPLDKPSISGFVVGSKKIIYLVMAGLFGLTLGLIVALFVDNQDHRIFDKYQVQEYLEIPVLGSISCVEE